ncbi:MAG: GyrI-like domain-containing protein [bacterium]|nr:GyrI-like domain-containing protein [bacterium]
MKYRIETFGEFRLVGYKERMKFENGENFIRIPEFWKEISKEGKDKVLMEYNDHKDLCCLGVCTNGDEKGFDYYIATGSSKEITGDLKELIVPAHTFVIFECVGKLPDAMQNVWKTMFTEWFPSSDYTVVDGPQMEWYGPGDMDQDDYVSEIWIPVSKKEQ